MITLMREVQLTSLFNKQHNIVNDVGMDTNEQMVLEELWHKIENRKYLFHMDENSSTHQGYPNHKCRGNDGQMCIRDRCQAKPIKSY